MIKTCLDYHRETSYDRNHMNGHLLDWASRPDVFKNYQGREPILLPKQSELPKEKLSKLLSGETHGILREGIDIATLSTLLLLAHTFTAKTESQEGTFYFRSAASAGALYPTELYAALHGVEDIDSGLYHYAIHHHGLVPLRTGDLGLSVVEAAGLREKAAPAVTFFLTVMFFRSAWKYRARAYRYHLLDTGHVEENLLLALKALGLSYHVSYDFDDDRVNDLLGLDSRIEVTLALVFLFGADVVPEGKKQEILRPFESVLESSRISARQVDYPVIREIHEAGRGRIAEKSEPLEMSDALGVKIKEWRHIGFPSERSEARDYPDCVFMRRSKRNFVSKPVQENDMAGILRSISASDRNRYEECLCVGFLIGLVEGMEPGFYLLDRKKQAMGMIVPGSYIGRMAQVCLDQGWLGNAGVHFLFLANLALIDRIRGPRGYRYAMMTAGRLGQRLYNAATAVGLGCCGIGALYDEEARELLGLNDSSRLLYLVAVGVVKRV
jgi:SagB-type dehydrogenase family enzyme